MKNNQNTEIVSCKQIWVKTKYNISTDLIAALILEIIFILGIHFLSINPNSTGFFPWIWIILIGPIFWLTVQWLEFNKFNKNFYQEKLIKNH